MRILVTNDDGYLALGIQTLKEAAAEHGHVDVVAPDREQSATSHSLTMHHPLRVRTIRDVRVVDGTPTDCVILAVGELLDERPDLVVSGINHGANLGDDVLYSGTVAGAMEATMLGIPAVAFSFVGSEPEAVAGWAPAVSELLGQIVGRDSFPKDTLLNVNIPAVDPADLRGVRVTRLGRRVYEGSLMRAHDPSGKEYFWIGGGQTRWWGEVDSDFHAIEEGFISVTPLHLDLTNFNLLQDIRDWELSL